MSSIFLFTKNKNTLDYVQTIWSPHIKQLHRNALCVTTPTYCRSRHNPSSLFRHACVTFVFRAILFGSFPFIAQRCETLCGDRAVTKKRRQLAWEVCTPCLPKKVPVPRQSSAPQYTRRSQKAVLQDASMATTLGICRLKLAWIWLSRRALQFIKWVTALQFGKKTSWRVIITVVGTTPILLLIMYSETMILPIAHSI